MKTHLGHYEIVGELGRGGMGVVYKGYEPSLSRYVAIKELSSALTGNPQVVERFLREARSMAMLNDPHIIQIYSIGQQNGQPFFVMEFVDGTCLSDLIARDGRLQASDAMKIVYQTAQGLSAAHARGVIHRDVKPANLMVSLRGQVKIADFGIALANQAVDIKLTGAGEFVGTPGYLSPEIVQGLTVDARSDIFSLGVVLFEMLTGRTPFSVESVYKLVLEVVQCDIPDVRQIRADIDPGVAAILAKMLMKDPGMRYQSMSELMADLSLHPFIANGAELGLKITAPKSHPITMVGMATPMASGIPTDGRTPAPPPNLDDAKHTPVAFTTGHGTVLMAEDRQEANTLLRQPVLQEAKTLLHQPIPNKSRLPKMAAGIAALFFLGVLVWLGLRSDAGGEAIARGSVQVERSWGITKIVVSDAYASARKEGSVLIKPLLDKMGLHVHPALVFDIAMILLGLSLIKSVLDRFFSRRRRNRQAARLEKSY